MEALRQLVVGPEQRRLDQVEHPTPEVIGSVLPEAIAYAAQNRPDELATPLGKPVCNAVRDVARREPGFFGEILAPAIGTAVRRAVADALAALMQRINQLLERGMSIRSLRWRIEARRTGRPYAEVVIAHTLVYRVEWAVLIHTETSLVLGEVSFGEVQARAPDQTSAMLQAINSFVSEALQPASPGAAVDAIEVGDLRLWIERDPAFTLAVAIRGTAPIELRERLRQTLESIHTLHHEHVHQPDPTLFADTHPLLVDCLAQQVRATPRRAQWILALVGLVTLLIVAMVLLHDAEHDQANATLRAAYERALSATPGMVVTSVQRADGRYVIRGLRDPRALTPAFVIAAAGLPPAETELAPYDSLDPRLDRPVAPPLAVADAAIRSLEQLAIPFETGASTVEPATDAIARAAELINRAQRASAMAHAALCVEVLGDSDEAGREQLNSGLRAARAANVARALEAAGVDARVLAPRAGDPLRPRAHARSATFRAALRPGTDPRGCAS